MGQLVHSGSQYTDDQRTEAAIQYAVKGTLSIVAQQLNIPRTTLIGWSKTEWWDEILVEIRQQNASEHITRYQSLTSKALKAAERGIDELEGEKLTTSDIKALVISGAASTDKGRLLMNQSTSLAGSAGNTQAIQALADQFAKLSKTQAEITNSVVSTQDKE